MSSTRKCGIAVTILTLTVAGALAPSGLADDSAKSKVKIVFGGPGGFAGTVSSKKDKCEKGRKVKLHYSDEPGGSKGDSVVGRAKTNADGAWRMDGMFFAGYYHAEVLEKERGDLLCRADGMRAVRF